MPRVERPGTSFEALADRLLGGILAALVSVLAHASAQAPAPSSSTSFEEGSAGPFTERASSLGRWSAAGGHARIDAEHARTGARCLHITGGTEHQVVLEPAPGLSPVSELTFWAERWTARAPFEFRIDTWKGGRWNELYRGGDEIVIGSFATRVRVPVDAPIERLRLTCTSPAGVLIDDWRFGARAPMELVSVTTRQSAVPCLIGGAGPDGSLGNRVSQVEIETHGSLEPLTVTALSLDTSGTTDLADLAEIAVTTAGGRTLGRQSAGAQQLIFDAPHELHEGVNVLTVRVRLAPDADLDHFVDADCVELHFPNGAEPVRVPSAEELVQRIGLDLRDAGDDGAAVYRIPALTTTTKGTLVAVYDVRWKGWGDLPGDIDVGLSRSTDGGRSWDPMRIILDTGDDPAFRYDGVGDPAILVDRQTGTIWVVATWSHGDRSWRGSGPGLTPAETGQLLLVRSTDDGLSWSDPINITAQVKRPEWCFLLQGPGRGITMQDGTLVFAAQYQDTPENGRTPHSTILYSRDHGESWSLGTGVRADTTEAQVVELEAGVLMLNMRDNRGGSRSIFTTRDLGRTWQEHATSRSALVEPVCNAALLRTGETTLLFVNPAVDRAPRRRMTLKASTDLGATWAADRALLLDEDPSAGYPSMTMIDDATIGVLFEGSEAQLTFLRIPLRTVLR